MEMPLPLRLRRRVLLVDDDGHARRQVHDLLTANDYAVTQAANGNIARSLLDAEPIDLIVTDIFMPECDGFELIAAIRDRPSPVPVIAMAGHESWTGLSFLDAANDLGAAAVIEKPFRGADLVRLIRDVLTATDRERRVISIDAGRQCARPFVPAGLEWLGSRRS